MNFQWTSRHLTPAGGLSLHVRERGEGPACLFIHGSGEGGYVWTDLAPALHPRYRALTLDLRGHGDSAWDPERGYDIQHHVADALSSIRALRLESLVIVGHSLGGDVALRCAAELGDRVLGVVAVDFGPGLNLEAIERGRQRFADLFREYRSAAEFEELLRNDRPLAPPESLQRVAAQALREHGSHLVMKCDPALLDCGYKPDDAMVSKLLGQIRCPALVVRGAGSAIFPRFSAQRMLRSLRRGSLKEVAMAGHGVMMDNPSGFTLALRPFLRDTIP